LPFKIVEALTRGKSGQTDTKIDTETDTKADRQTERKKRRQITPEEKTKERCRRWYGQSKRTGTVHRKITLTHMYIHYIHTCMHAQTERKTN
jgi:hypothetical protein